MNAARGGERWRIVAGTDQANPSAPSPEVVSLGHVGLHRTRLLAFIMRRVRDAALAEDIAQEALTKLLAYQARTEVLDPGALSYRIAENLVRSHYRGLRTAFPEPLDDELPFEGQSADEMLIDKDRVALLESLLARMPPLRRAVLIRRRLHGESHAQISAALGLTPAAVEKHMVRAMAWLSQASAKTRNGPGGFW